MCLSISGGRTRALRTGDRRQGRESRRRGRALHAQRGAQEARPRDTPTSSSFQLLSGLPGQAAELSDGSLARRLGLTGQVWEQRTGWPCGRVSRDASPKAQSQAPRCAFSRGSEARLHGPAASSDLRHMLCRWARSGVPGVRPHCSELTGGPSTTGLSSQPACRPVCSILVPRAGLQ